MPSTVEQKPSVMESPNVTTAAAVLEAVRTSTDFSHGMVVIGVVNLAAASSPVTSPAPAAVT